MKRIPTDTGAVLRFFRFSKGVSEEELAGRAGVKPQAVRRWENGDVPLPREQLIELLGEHLEVPPEAVETALFAHRLATQPEEPEGPGALSTPERRLIGRAAAAGGKAGTETALRELVHARLRQHAARDTAWAEEEWSRLKKLPLSLQELAVRALQGGERSWALAIRICEASCGAAAHSAAEALRLARLGEGFAQAAPGSPRWRLRLLGCCEPFVANALRVAGDLAAARSAFAHADEAWSQGEGGDPAGLLDGVRRLDLKASLLREDGQFAEALQLLAEALAASPPEAAARLLIQKATMHTKAGDYKLAIEVLRQAEPRIDGEREPRMPFLYRFTLALNHCHLDLYQDAESLLPLVETLASDLHTKLDEVRTRWLRGRIRAGKGRREEALAALSQVREYFLSEKIAYDFALVSLEMATLYLEQGRTGLVKQIAEEMFWIFKSQKIHEEALAALALFCHAAQEEEAEADWTRSLVKYLYRAQYNPKLRFEEP